MKNITNPYSNNTVGTQGIAGPMGATGRVGVYSVISPIDAINENGIVISGSNIKMQLANDLYSGLISTDAQLFTGSKTFIDNVSIPVANLNALTITTGGTINSGGAIIAPEAITSQIITNSITPKTGSNVSFTSDISGVSSIFSNIVEAGDFYTNGSLTANTSMNTSYLTANTVNVNTLSPTSGNILTISIPGYASFALKASGSSITTLESAATATRNILLPNASDTLVGKSTTDTFTNKIITGSSNNVEAKSLSTTGASVSTNTSAPPTTGQVLMASSPTVSIWKSLPVANITTAGIVDTNAQSFAGIKTFPNGVRSSTTSNQRFGDTPFPLLTSGTDNNGFGIGALASISSGSQNNGFGSLSCNLVTTSQNNTGIGFMTLANATGNNNTAIGSAAGGNLTTGSSNIFIGLLAGTNITSADNDIMIGNQGVLGDFNTIRIGNTNHTKTFITGISGKTTGLTAINCMVDANGQLGTISSLRELKDNIEDIDEETNKNLIKSLIPRRFTMKSNGLPSYGLIVDEVPDNDLLAFDLDNNPYTVRYDQIPILLLKEVQRLSKEIDVLKEEMKMVQFITK